MDTYQTSARYYDLLSGHKDYRAASDVLVSLIRAANPAARSLLDVACGTGGHLAHLRDAFDVEGLDLSGPMLEVARLKCPGIAFHQASLAEFELDRTFDAIVCLFGSVGYCHGFGSLQGALRNMAKHLNPGGVLVIEPWVTSDNFLAHKLTFDWVDRPEIKIARMYVSERVGDLSILDARFMVAEEGGVQTFSERHELFLFTEGQYQEALSAAGMKLLHSDDSLFGYGLFVALKG